MLSNSCILFKVFSNFGYYLYTLWLNSTSRPSHTHSQLNVPRNTCHFFIFPRFKIYFIHRSMGWCLKQNLGVLKYFQLPTEKRLLSFLFEFRESCCSYIHFVPFGSSKATLSTVILGLNNSKQCPHPGSDPCGDPGVYSGRLRWKFFILRKQKSARKCD